ncbi:hypothetical protein F5Y03DRAFT_237456 [Xylaria venustula]|nr:hypothetical protein F5Y03DRAFT_237456 [Xylaria venustula]
MPSVPSIRHLLQTDCCTLNYHDATRVCSNTAKASASQLCRMAAGIARAAATVCQIADLLYNTTIPMPSPLLIDSHYLVKALLSSPLLSDTTYIGTPLARIRYLTYICTSFMDPAKEWSFILKSDPVEPSPSLAKIAAKRPSSPNPVSNKTGPMDGYLVCLFKGWEQGYPDKLPQPIGRIPSSLTITCVVVLCLLASRPACSPVESHPSSSWPFCLFVFRFPLLHLVSSSTRAQLSRLSRLARPTF